MRFSLALATLATGLVLPTGVAAASTVSVPSPGGAAVYQAAPGPSDLVAHFDFATGFQFEDFAQPITVGAGCVPGTPVTCAATAADVRFGDKSDRFRGAAREPITITAGGGRDSIRTAGEWNTVSAGDGNDSVWENGNSLGSVNGDAGADKLYSFEAATRLHGGLGNDLLVGGSTSFGHQLSGDGGDDEIVVNGSGSGTASGGDGRRHGRDRQPQFGGFTIDGGSGADTIKAGPSTDTITAGAGYDVIDVTGDPGNADSVSCGTGKDIRLRRRRRRRRGRLRADLPLHVRRSPPSPARAPTPTAFVAAMPDIPAF